MNTDDKEPAFLAQSAVRAAAAASLAVEPGPEDVPDVVRDTFTGLGREQRRVVPDRKHWPDCAINHGGAACDMGPACGADKLAEWRAHAADCALGCHTDECGFPQYNCDTGRRLTEPPAPTGPSATTECPACSGEGGGEVDDCDARGGHRSRSVACETCHGERVVPVAAIVTDPGTEEGETCGRDGCDGVIRLSESENCSCHLNAPCNACLGSHPECPECDWSTAG